jgi:hypothetical protein
MLLPWFANPEFAGRLLAKFFCPYSAGTRSVLVDTGCVETMNVMQYPRKVGLAVGMAIALLLSGPRGQAATFSQADVSQGKFIAIAVPRSGNYYSLLILEQLSAQKQCWRESGTRPTRVEPLLLNFDFTKICGRSTDSNGYSVRIAGQDRGLDYRLSVQKQGDEVVLLGLPRSGGNRLEIGRSNGFSSGFLKLTLNPGWRFAKRVYNGKKLGHVYLTRNAMPTATTTKPKSPAPPASKSASPTAEPTKLSAIKPKRSLLFRKSHSESGTTRSLTNRKSSQTKTSRRSETSNTTYRLMVVAADPGQQARLRSQMPGAFRTRHEGKSVMQVGIFSNKEKANDLKKQLKRQGFKVLIVSDRRQADLPTPDDSPALASNSVPNPSVLSVPGERIPLGHSRGYSTLPPPPPSPQLATAPRYRVLVMASRKQQQSQIRELIPGSFRSTYRGQSVMQIGSYPDPDEATNVMERVKVHGFEPILERTP